jgi:uncharacterized protein YydD (DUF2326 family)
MLHRLYSNDPEFKTLTFRPGLNVLVAEMAKGATERQSRNGAGKSSFVRLVHFLLGADCDKGHVLRDPSLQSFTFGMEFDLGGEVIGVERSPSQPSRVFFPKPPKKAWPIGLQNRREETRLSLSNTDWKAVLGHLVFGLKLASDERRAEKFIPTFRGLFPYFARLHEDGAFQQPYAVFSKQQLWNQQVAIAYLFGLDWRIPQGMQLIRAKERAMRDLEDVLSETAEVQDLLPRSDDLQARLTIAEDRASQVRASLKGYRINPEYHDLEVEVDGLTSTINRTLDEDTWDRDVIANIEEALSSESPPEPADLQRLYKEATVELPAIALKTFDDVKAFHASVLRNRQSYLNGELKGAQDRIGERSKQRDRMDARRSQLMAVLSSTGALDQFTQLQAELGRLEGQAEHLRRQTAAARELEKTKLQLEIEAAELELRLGQNHDEQHDRIAEAQRIFAAISRRMYEEPGTLTVNNKLSGPPVRAVIHAQQSVGIQKMQIFCFDLTLSRLVSNQGRGPGFLIHDSHLFDGVDPRQVRHALSVAAAEATDYGLQYIVTLNSDKAGSIADAGLDLRPHMLPVTLTDQAQGGLFGRRFG